MTGLSGCTLVDQHFGSNGSNGPDGSPEAAPTTVTVDGTGDETIDGTVESHTPEGPDSSAVVASPGDESSTSTVVPPNSETQAPDNRPSAPDTYPEALKKASLALSLSELAQSTDDWALVAGLWQQALDLLEAVPISSEHYNAVAAKRTEYRGKRDVAKTQANQPVPTSAPLGSIVVAAADEADNAALTAPNSEEEGTETASNSLSQATANDPGEDTETAGNGLYLAPIVRRSGGTPVIHVKFNGQSTVEMIVDTGASGTVLTQEVARRLGVESIGETNIATASAQNVPFLLGRVASIEVDGATLDDVVVAIAGPDLETGLLGNDFFKDYDVTVKADVVEFRAR